MEKIKCQICGIERNNLQSHIFHFHKITTKKYREMFPSSKISFNKSLFQKGHRFFKGNQHTVEIKQKRANTVHLTCLKRQLDKYSNCPDLLLTFFPFKQIKRIAWNKGINPKPIKTLEQKRLNYSNAAKLREQKFNEIYNNSRPWVEKSNENRLNTRRLNPDGFQRSLDGLKKGNQTTKKQREGKTLNQIYGEEKSLDIKNKIKLKRQHQIFPIQNTSIENKLYDKLLNLNLAGGFERNGLVGGFRYDFVSKKHKIIIECDGDYWHANPIKYFDLNTTQKHNSQHDEIKNIIAEQNDFTIIRFWESEINNDIQGIGDFILNHCNYVNGEL